jgi:hypothetical protein
MVLGERWVRCVSSMRAARCGAVVGGKVLSFIALPLLCVMLLFLRCCQFGEVVATSLVYSSEYAVAAGSAHLDIL